MSALSGQDGAAVARALEAEPKAFIDPLEVASVRIVESLGGEGEQDGDEACVGALVGLVHRLKTGEGTPTVTLTRQRAELVQRVVRRGLVMNGLQGDCPGGLGEHDELPTPEQVANLAQMGDGLSVGARVLREAAVGRLPVDADVLGLLERIEGLAGRELAAEGRDEDRAWSHDRLSEVREVRQLATGNTNGGE
jgi:hypothetical protein